ncbi:MAG: DUF3306 domain-containing protein [Alphaproteobacteria bacterium]|nr:DUF3306 domain-containing protein [Alphaproteobacteria bacterium]
MTVANVDPGFPAASAPEGGLPAVAPGEDTPAGEDAAKDLPPIDGLDKDSDYTPFLGDGVPEKLARAAMRKLWRSDPIFAFRDGLDDYDEDFSMLHSIAKAVTSKAGKAKAKAKKAKAAAKAKKAKAEAKAKKAKAEAKAKKAKAEAKAKKTAGRAEARAAGTKEGKAKQKKKTAARKGPRAGEEEKA